MTTIGKYRHLTRASNIDGHFVIMAIDHRDNLLAQLNQHADAPLSDEAFTDYKQTVIEALAPHATAVLTDPAYGIGEGVVEGTLPAGIGLLAPIEVTDYALHPSERELALIPNWSVAKIKRIGADGVKLLLPYHPSAQNAETKHEIVRQIIADCAIHDIPFYLEPIAYSLDPNVTLTNDERRQITVTMTRTFSDMGVDILKLPFPIDSNLSDDYDEWRSACEAVNDVCEVPWVLLSAGVDFDVFAKQTEIACQAGASGVIVGRAVWKESIALKDDALDDFLDQKAVFRMMKLAEICEANARSWQESIDPPTITPTWYEQY